MRPENFKYLNATNISHSAGVLAVGGFVRDLLLGRSPRDLDYVVVGMTHEQLRHECPEVRESSVGKTFPTFIDNYHLEYAFARTYSEDFQLERVTLAEDLSCRDLTINALALCPETDTILHAEKSLEDIDNKVLRHLPHSFETDPVRILRLARFQAKFPDFTIATETVESARENVHLLNEVSPERIWIEVEKALAEDEPAIFFETLRRLNALAVWFKELHECCGVLSGPFEFHGDNDVFEHSMKVLRNACKASSKTSTRFAALCHDLGKGQTPEEEWKQRKHHDHAKLGEECVPVFCDRLKVPNQFKTAAVIAAKEHMRASQCEIMKVGKVVDFLYSLKAFPGGILEFCAVIDADGSNSRMLRLLEEFRIERLKDIKLPEHQRNRGRASFDLLRQLRIAAFREFKIAKRLKLQNWSLRD